MSIEETRREKLLELIDSQPWPQDHGKQKILAERVGVTSSYIGQMKSGHRPINEKTARGFEEKLNLPVGWMDGDDTADRYNDKILVQLVSDIEGIVKSDPNWDIVRIVRFALTLHRVYATTGEYPNARQALLVSQLGGAALG